MRNAAFLVILPAAFAAVGAAPRAGLEQSVQAGNPTIATAPVIYLGKSALQLVARDPDTPLDPLVTLIGKDFSNGTIQAEVAGKPAPGAAAGARGFIGIAFRVQPQRERYEAFYIRPTNGRSEDQLRRNHSTQYISMPDYPWQRLRSETPGVYESYADMVAGAWTKLKIEVSGGKARLYVNDSGQPSLIVNDLKLGPGASGGVALWIGPGTEGYFRNVRVTSGG